MNEFAALTISGLVGGGLVAMLAIGLVMTYTTTGIFNFAQGAIALFAAYAFLELRAATGMPKYLCAIVVVLVIAPLFGLLLEVAIFRHLSRAPEFARIVGTIGLALAIPAAAIILIENLVKVPGLQNRMLDVGEANAIALGPEPTKTWMIGAGIIVNSNQLIVIVLTVVNAVLYWFILRRTRLGLEMRAVVDGYGLATIRGVSHARVSRVSWMLSFTSAALVGVCGSITLGLSANNYLQLVIVASAAAVIGRLRSIPVTFVAALLLGVVQNLVTFYLQRGPLSGINGLGPSVPFVALLLGLYVLSKRRTRVAGVGSAATDAPVELTPERRTPRQRAVTLILVLAAVVLILNVVGPYWSVFVAEGIGLSLVYLSFVVVTGQVGVVSLAQAGYVAGGGLIAGWLATSFGLPMWLAVLIAVTAAAAAGAVVALSAVRLGGLQLSLATLALAFLLQLLVFDTPAVQGPNGTGWSFRRPTLFGLDLADSAYFSVFLIAVLIVFVILVRNYQLSQIGRSGLALRGSRPGAVSSGVSPVTPIVVAFAFSGLIAGVGGVIYAQTFSQITSQSNPPLNALLWVTIAVTIGIRRPSGAILAGLMTALMTPLLSYITTSTQWPLLLFGLGAVMLGQYPGGTLDLQRRQGTWVATKVKGLMSRGESLDRDTSSLAEEVTARSEAPPEAVGSRPSATLPNVREFKVGDSSAQGGMGAALTVRALRSGYGELEVLHGIDLHAHAGKITAVFGANGSGKSTLCAALGGLGEVSAGEIYVDGKQITELSGPARLRAGLFVVTESKAVFPNLTVDENLRLALRTGDLVRQALQEFPELAARRDTTAGMLSGGEQQLLAMAPAVITRPRVLVADEPNLGLAPLARARMLSLFERLRSSGTAVLLVEERPGDVFGVADEVVLLRLGHIVWQCSAAEVSADVLLDSYLAKQA